MGKTKAVSLLLLALIAISMLSTQVLARNRYGPGSLKPSQCSAQCTRRCSKAHEHESCLFFCQKCCGKCLCVPPGTYGNKEVCPCYNSWKTQQGGPKCP